MTIRQARTKRDEAVILSMIAGDPGLQKDRLPPVNEFLVVEKVIGERKAVVGCCALKRISPKLGEIRSFAFSHPEMRSQYGHALVQKCIDHAREQGVYQLYVTLSEREQGFFHNLSFRPFNEEKFAMLQVLRGRGYMNTTDLPKIDFRSGNSDYRKRIEDLVRRYPDKLIQPESKLFPPISNFLLALSGRRLVGCCALTIFRPKQKGEPELAEIRSLAVDPESEGQGIGRELVIRQINRAIRSRVWELLAVTSRKGWFEKLGFSTRRGSEEAWFMVLNGNGG